MQRIKRVITASIILLLLSGLVYYLPNIYAMAAVPEPFTDPHGSYNSVTPKCAKCHTGHVAGAEGIARGNSQRETCYACHDGSNASPDIRHQFGENTIGSSVYSSHHPVPEGTQICTNCHDPHLANDSAPGGTASLLAVGPSKISSGNAVCGYCHGPGSTAPGGDMLTLFTGTAHDVTMTNPASGTQIKCARCHQPHGSSLDVLLRNNITDNSGVTRAVYGNNNTVCFACHVSATGGYSGETIFKTTYHGTKTSSTVATVTYKGTAYSGTQCLNCHEPHGKTGVTYYRRANGNTLCITCHDDPSNNRPANYSYRGIDYYNASTHGSAESIPNPNMYNLTREDSLAWESSGAVSPTPASPGSTAASDQKGYASSANSAFWSTGLAVTEGNYNYQMFKFHIEQNVADLRRFYSKWVGYGEPTAAHPTELLIWNKNTAAWVLLASAQLSDPNNPGTLTGTVSTNLQNYVDENNDVYILARALHDGLGPTVSGVTVTNGAGTSVILNFTTNETATSYVYYGTTPGVYTNWVEEGTYGTSHSVIIGSLTNDVTYYYQIQAYDKLGNRTDYTNQFHTSYTPSTPTITGDLGNPTTDPSPNNTVVVNLKWNASIDLDPTDTLTYEIEVFVNGGSYFTGTSSVTNRDVTLSYYDGPYTVQWRIRAKDNHGLYSSWSSFSGFTTFPHTGPSSWTSSCPILYTWDGQKYQYITDVAVDGLIGQETDPFRKKKIGREAVIPDGMLEAKDGSYILKLKNDQDEIDYHDNWELQAVDHPVGTDIALNNLEWQTEPTRIYTVGTDIRPIKKATYLNNPVWSGGKPTALMDITDIVNRLDHVYSPASMYDDNQYTFDLGDLSDARDIKMVITGWTQYSSSQEKVKIIEKNKQGVKRAKNFLEILQPDGTWKTESSLNIISGYPKTAVLNLTGNFPPNTKKYIVRFRGMLRSHFDFVGVDTTPQATIKVTDLDLTEANLSYRGVSVKQGTPPDFDYDTLVPVNEYSHKGKFTRYGDVLPLLKDIDDKFVVVDAGDEVTLRFKALDPPAPGMVRSFVLKPWVYYKVTAYARQILGDPGEPLLPFGDMKQYPYPSEQYPKELKKYAEEWNTREGNANYPNGHAEQSLFVSIKQFFTGLRNWSAKAWAALMNKVAAVRSESPGVYHAALVSSPISKPVPHYSINTDYVELEVRSVDAAIPTGYCGNCHAVHGSDDGTGTAYPKQLLLGKSEVCFGGGNGACHSGSENSDRNINIQSKFTASSNILSHHSVSPSEYAAGGNSKLECVNCHDPHLNNATNKLVDPQNRYTAYSVYNDVSKYIGSEGEVYVLAKARHDGKAPVITVQPAATNAPTSCTIDWWTDEPSNSLVYYGTSPNPATPAGSSTEQLTHHTVNVTGLSAGTMYWFKVRSMDAVGNYEESSVTQMDNTDPVIPVAPVISSSGVSATVTWTTDEPATSIVDSMPQVDYAVYNDFIGPSVISIQGDGNGYVTSHSVTVSGLTPGQSYKLRVRSSNYRGLGTSSLVAGTIWSTNRPFAPTFQYGPDYVSDQTSNHDINLIWNAASDPDPGDTITGYYIELSQSNTFNPAVSTVFSPGWITNTNWATSIYNDGLVRWYWRVKAKDNWNAESVWSATYSFQHQGYVPPPPTSSCPNLYVWDGQKYQFVTDMADSTVGKRSTLTGKYLETFPDRPIVIPWNMMQEKNGQYSIKIKSERDEVDFIDWMSLLAVDHPVGTRLGYNDLERGKRPAEMFTYSTNLQPLKKATYFDNATYTGVKGLKAVDITDLVAKEDNREAKGVFGDDNQFTFDLGNMEGAKNIKLVMLGWTQFNGQVEHSKAMKKTGRGVKRAKTFYEILQPDGTWKNYSITHFNGLPKTVVLDLTGKFPKDTTKYVVRLRGMHRPRIDYVGVDTSSPVQYTVRNLEVTEASLGYRGISSDTKDGKGFDYDNLSKVKQSHEGNFTKYGDVRPLVQEVDDKLVVMDSGDEISMNFKALPPPAPGMTRSFIIKPWVYFKEFELAKVEPMPFRKQDMTKLPHSLGEYPAELKDYVAKWNTREHHAGKWDKTTSEQIADFFSKIGDYITTAWRDTFGSFEREETKPSPIKKNDNGGAVLTYKLYKNSPFAGYRAEKGHYSLNTNQILLRTDTLKVIANVYADSAAGFKMWESGGDTSPTPTSGGTEQTGLANKVRNDDTDLWTTNYFNSSQQNDGAFNYQMFKFILPASDVSNLYVFWKGRGEPSPGYNVHISFWNFQTNSWDEVNQQLMGQENTMTGQKYVDYNAYCYRCHSGTVPSGVQLGTIGGQPVRNIGASFPNDKHGSDNAGQQGFSDAGGYFNLAWRVTSLGTMKSPYSRGHANLPCTDCHDLHGSQNAYHLRENPNGVSVGPIPTNTDTSTNNQVEAFCQACHQGDRSQYHDYCIRCHTMVGYGHYSWTNSNVQSADFNAACLSCHKHGGAIGPHSVPGCHCGLDYTVKAF